VRPDEARTVYDGALFDVTLERWGRHEREIVEHPGAVCVVAVDREGCVALVRQLREATGGELLELPAGTAEPGETPIETARRELAEETGLTGGRWREVCAFWTTPGFTRERMTLFFAEGVEPGGGRVLRARPLAVRRDRVAPRRDRGREEPGRASPVPAGHVPSGGRVGAPGLLPEATVARKFARVCAGIVPDPVRTPPVGGAARARVRAP
jgi:ADP-ribose pyrophosphatase YjhB (NUDIX family)